MAYTLVQGENCFGRDVSCTFNIMKDGERVIVNRLNWPDSEVANHEVLSIKDARNLWRNLRAYGWTEHKC